MNKPDWQQQMASAINGQQRKPTIVLLTSTVLMLVWSQFGSQDFYHAGVQPWFVVYDDPAYSAALYFFLSAFVIWR